MTTMPSHAVHLIPDLPSADEIAPWLQRIDLNRWYTNYGPLVQAFEAEIAGLLAAANPGRSIAVTSLSTGYHALELGLRVLDLKPAGKVLMPAVTFPACPLAAIHAGLTPVFTDVDESSWALTPDIARRVAAKHAIQAVMPVAVYGVPVSADDWEDFTRDTGIPVLIDAAAAVETQKIPVTGLVAHSLHATKPFGIGEGGLLVGADRDRIARVRELSNFGTRERIAWGLGTNAKMSEFHAAVGLAQCARWPAIKTRRHALFERFRAALAGLPITLQPGIETAVPSLLMISVAPYGAAEVMTVMKSHGVPVHRTYLPPLYAHPAFQACPVASATGRLSARTATQEVKAKLCPQAEFLARHVIGLPFHPFMDDAALAGVAQALGNARGVMHRK